MIKQFTTSLTLVMSMLAAAAMAKPITPAVIMDFQSLTQPVLSDNGATLAYVAAPDRGDSIGKLQRIGGNLFSIDGGSAPILSADGQFALFVIEPPLLARENADAQARKKLKADRVLIDSQSGQMIRFERVKQAWFSADGKRLLLLHELAESQQPDSKEAEDNDKAKLGTSLTVRDLATGKTRMVSHVRQVVMAKDANVIAYSTATDNGANGIYLLNGDLSSTEVHRQAGHISGDITLSDDGQLLAFSWGNRDEAKRQRQHQVAIFEVDEDLRWLDVNHADFIVSGYSELTFSADNQRLFIGRQARRPRVDKPAEFADAQALQDITQLQNKADLVLWHGDDPRIKTHEQKQFEDEFKRQFLGVWNLDQDEFVQLADPQLEQVLVSDNGRYLLGSSDQLYRRMQSWAGSYRDWYLVDMNNGQRRLLITQASWNDSPTLATDDSAVAWYVRGELFWHDIKANSTSKVGPGFANEDHDYPSPAPSYGFGPWLADGQGLIVYDKYDLHLLQRDKLKPLTEGRQRQVSYRVVEQDPQLTLYPLASPLLLHSTNQISRDEGLHLLNIATGAVNPWRQYQGRIRFVSKAKNSAAALYSQERYDQFPDLYLAEGNRGDLTQVTFLGKQLDDLDWGNAKPVQWRNDRGQDLTGVVITPEGWDGTTPLPTVVYFYRLMGQYLHRFPQMALNHRPNFPWYNSQGFAIFMPDVKFAIGEPGASTKSALLSGVERLVELGITDPNRVGLNGHSWAGYQGAQLVTQTDAFAAVVAGAPVSNMTSAYTGIRLKSGLGRQFQYEAGQSRIGVSLYRAPELYLENSPVFNVDKINTPMLIMFGDQDDAVPWQQGIELYLAMRRLSKPVVMLQYQGEPHHLKQYPNKVDYALKTMAFYQHTLQGKPAPQWWLNGQPWRQPDLKQ
ncbi:alpha/beta hydrolase family protein [Ferrimonas senticii]|uniref:alpha/beta hydrolase family protein n=1 Tax=Ferrimonas senticii TaxID=394566 RepID=UPI000555F587|nr:prolyl oligopeptidase family serine peptidase [Ferrimonas senticii]